MRTVTRIMRALALVLVLLTLSDCRRSAEFRSLPIATTTSLAGSGLLEVLGRELKHDTGIELHAFVVGSGQALQLARRGEVDVVISHDPDAERAFVATAKPLLYRQFMWNDFVIAGPPGDPASIASSLSAVDAFTRIAASRSKFCSRGDHSGTHSKELKIWAGAHIDPTRNPGYLSMGQPMAHLLRSANELEAYLLTDRATFDRIGPSTSLRVLFAGDPQLKNVYAVTLVNTNPAELRNAQVFADWLLGSRGQQVIQQFKTRGHREFWLLSEKPAAGLAELRIEN
ncbi:MAG TPA: substrate-binding domain-containing protein [Thermoanaerobaculia bacterium]|nr:substrate-binding domain-containing protein [Thermoanaerobaculia bacterium]